MRVEIYVRPNASAADVGGAFDGALAVRVTDPAVDGRATDAALAAVAAATACPAARSRWCGEHAAGAS